jgi:hypothetical protein
MIKDRRKLINEHEMRHHSKRCRLPTDGYQYGYSQKEADEATLRHWDFHFARHFEEQMIVPHNPALLAEFRCHHCLEGIHSDQCMASVVKHCANNTDKGTVCVESVRYVGYPIKSNQKVQWFGASRVASSSECFASVCGFWR